MGNKIAIRGTAPVFGKIKGSHFPEAEQGDIQFYHPSEVKNHEFIWAAWVNHKDSKADVDSLKKFELDTAMTLNLLKKTMLDKDSEVLSLHVPAEKLPEGEEDKVAYRNSFLKVVSHWAREQAQFVMLHSLIDRELADELKEEVETDEVELVKEMSNPYLIPMPRKNGGTDLIATAEEFLQQQQNGNLDTAGVAPTIVTLIPADGWNHIGGDAIKVDSKTGMEEQFYHTVPLATSLFSLPVNKFVWADLARQLL